MSISYYKGMLLNNMADATKINYKAYYNNYILFGANASPEPEPDEFPITDFSFNFNFKKYNYDTQSVPNESTANWLQDLVLNGTPVVDTDHITIEDSDAFAQFPFDTKTDNIFNQNNTNGYEMTIIFKVSNFQGTDLISNRGYAKDSSVSNTNNYNWMARPYTSQKMYLHDSSGAKGGLSVSTNPNIVVMKVDSNSTLTIKSLTDNLTQTTANLVFGNQSGRICFFCTNGYNKTTTYIRELFNGTCYWMFHAKRILTDDEITQVVEYNENMASPTEPAPNYSQQYLTFVAKSSGTFNFSGSSSTNAVSYSTDNGTNWSTPSTSVTINVNDGDNVLWKGSAMTPQSNKGIGTFSASTASFDIQGNGMSMLYGDNFVGQTDLSGKNYALCGLFRSTKCVRANKLILPSATLVQSCYVSMFHSCTYLTLPPELPATTLAQYCYNAMFYGCTSLEKTPKLFATTLVDYCYDSMFYGCTNLNYVKIMATSISASGCLSNWLSGVASIGTFIQSSSITYYSGASGIPNGWVRVNK